MYQACEFHPCERMQADNAELSGATIATFPSHQDPLSCGPPTSASTETPPWTGWQQKEKRKEKRARPWRAGCPAVPSGHTGTSDGNTEGIIAVTEMKLINPAHRLGKAGCPQMGSKMCYVCVCVCTCVIYSNCLTRKNRADKASVFLFSFEDIHFIMSTDSKRKC